MASLRRTARGWRQSPWCERVAGFGALVRAASARASRTGAAALVVLFTASGESLSELIAGAQQSVPMCAAESLAQQGIEWQSNADAISAAAGRNAASTRMTARARLVIRSATPDRGDRVRVVQKIAVLISIVCDDRPVKT